MDVDHPERDQAWDHQARSETETQRLDRNWNILLQELRVLQTGVQFLTGFLLVLPFQQRFDVLHEAMRDVYLATVACSVGSAVLLIGPVGMHRILFRQRKTKQLVSAAHRLAFSGLCLLGLALAGVTVIIFDAVAGHTAAVVAGSCTFAALLGFWIVLPLAIRFSGRSTDEEAIASNGLHTN
ncbi:MAG TPA: DUF6328 family protein [Mycobacterium sp.]|nr:DUF6328 family protein [Mycobacterium sp.]